MIGTKENSKSKAVIFTVFLIVYDWVCLSTSTLLRDFWHSSEWCGPYEVLDIESWIHLSFWFLLHYILLKYEYLIGSYLFTRQYSKLLYRKQLITDFSGVSLRPIDLYSCPFKLNGERQRVMDLDFILDFWFWFQFVLRVRSWLPSYLHVSNLECCFSALAGVFANRETGVRLMRVFRISGTVLACLPLAVLVFLLRVGVCNHYLWCPWRVLCTSQRALQVSFVFHYTSIIRTLFYFTKDDEPKIWMT